MSSAVCTLFEGDYHYGVGALANSLYAHGFRGAIYAGYRGPLPPWAKNVNQFDGYSEFSPADGLVLRFIPLTTKVHFTNYKPDFMLEVWERHCPQAKALFYFDPDIVIRCQWAYFETWVTSGVALCEDVCSPLSFSHPLRKQWIRIYSQNGIKLNFPNDAYVNGGFVGVHRDNQGFLSQWDRTQQTMAIEIGGLEKTGGNLGGREHPFGKTDQDALNIVLGWTDQPTSIIGKEGMDLAPGGFTMSHTLGTQKGWNTTFILEALKGAPPTASAKNFFRYVEHPITLFGKGRLFLKRLDIRIAALLGRFYRKS